MAEQPNGVKVARRKLKDYVLDPENANEGTARGRTSAARRARAEAHITIQKANRRPGI